MWKGRELRPRARAGRDCGFLRGVWWAMRLDSLSRRGALRESMMTVCEGLVVCS
jgi:hypothetical protein